MKLLKLTVLALSLSLVSTSCNDDFVETKFYQSVEQAPLTTKTEVAAAVRGIYTSMRASSYLGRDYIAYGEVRSDEMYSNLASGYFTTVYNYSQTSNDGSATDTYVQIYTALAKANIVINTDVNSVEGTAADRASVEFYKGQALVLRGLLAFDLLKLYGQKYTGGDLGIVYPLEYNPEARHARGTIAENEAQIEKDITEGLALMEKNSSYNPVTKTELSIDAAKGLATRYYLYKKDYETVRTLVADIIGKYSVVAKDAYIPSWTLNNASPNSIFELAVGTGGSLGTSSLYYIYSANGYGNTVLKEEFYNTYADEDVRKEILVVDGDVYLEGKYTTRESNIKLLRYEEVLLNAIEAELNGGDAAKALEYYNEILVNRGLAEAASVDMEALKVERAKELVGEGFRYWDLLRWGDWNTNLVPSTATSYTTNRLAFPIPASETNLSGTLVKANPGYDN